MQIQKIYSEQKKKNSYISNNGYLLFTVKLPNDVSSNPNRDKEFKELMKIATKDGYGIVSGSPYGGYTFRN